MKRPRVCRKIGAERTTEPFWGYHRGDDINMKKHNKTAKVIAVSIAFGFIVLMIFAYIVFLKSCSPDNYYYKININEWSEAEYYEVKEKKHLGHLPENIFCNIYEVVGFSENEILYLTEKGMIGFGNDEASYLLVNKSVDEPIKTNDITSVSIQTENGIVVIDAPDALECLTNLLHTQTGTRQSETISFNRNSTIEFNGGNLQYFCDITKQSDGTISLTMYDMKNSGFYSYNVTEIFGDFM